MDLVAELLGQKGLQPLPAKSLKKFNPKIQAFKPVFKLTGG